MSFRVALAALAALLPATSFAAWTVETVAPFGPMSSMALTADGRPVVAYSVGQTVAVATRDAGGVWSYEYLAIPTLAAPKGANQTQLLYVSDPSLVVDPVTSEPRVAWLRQWDHDVWYGERASGTWSYELLSGDGGAPSLVIDRDGASRVAFGGVYGVRTAGTWTFEPVGPSWSEGSLLLDAQERPYLVVALGSGTSSQLRFESRAEGGWSSEEIESSGHSIWQTSAALDGAGQPHVAFVDDVSQLVRYARRVSDQWEVETVAGPVGAGSGVSLALGAGGEPFIAYWNVTADDQMFARRVGGNWMSEAVDAEGYVGGHSSRLAIDRMGRPHLVYVDYHTNRVRYATMSAPVTIVDPAEASLGFGIASVGPNPARSGGAIDLALHLDGPRRITVSLLDLSGRRVASREPAEMGVGLQSIRWSPRVAGGGLYFLDVTTDRGERRTTRVTLLP